MASLTFEIATKHLATSSTTRIERNRSKLEVKVLPTAEGLVSSMNVTNELGYVLASSVLAQFLSRFKLLIHTVESTQKKI